MYRLIDTQTFNRIIARFQYVGYGPSDYRKIATGVGVDTLLDLIDATLHIQAESGIGNAYVKSLEALLCEGRSIWKVNKSENGLECRQDQTIIKATGKAVETANRAYVATAGDRLRIAWESVYGLHPDPSKGYREAILTVEASAIPKILPNQPSATLGHVLGQLDRQGRIYEVAIADKYGTRSVAPVVGLIRLLWEGRTDRHEGNIPAILVTQESAEMALHLATDLVQWFSSGAIRRRQNNSAP